MPRNNEGPQPERPRSQLSLGIPFPTVEALEKALDRVMEAHPKGEGCPSECERANKLLSGSKMLQQHFSGSMDFLVAKGLFDPQELTKKAWAIWKDAFIIGLVAAQEMQITNWQGPSEVGHEEPANDRTREQGDR